MLFLFDIFQSNTGAQKKEKKKPELKNETLFVAFFFNYIFLYIRSLFLYISFILKTRNYSFFHDHKFYVRPLYFWSNI